MNDSSWNEFDEPIVDPDKSVSTENIESTLKEIEETFMDDYRRSMKTPVLALIDKCVREGVRPWRTLDSIHRKMMVEFIAEIYPHDTPHRVGEMNQTRVAEHLKVTRLTLAKWIKEWEESDELSTANDGKG